MVAGPEIVDACACASVTLVRINEPEGVSGFNTAFNYRPYGRLVGAGALSSVHKLRPLNSPALLSSFCGCYPLLRLLLLLLLLLKRLRCIIHSEAVRQTAIITTSRTTVAAGGRCQMRPALAEATAGGGGGREEEAAN